MDSEPTQVTTDNARQGESGHGVRLMLMIGVALVVIGFAVAVAMTGHAPNAP